MTRFAFFSAQSVSHLRFLLPLADALVRKGHEVHLWTEAVQRDEVERAGIRFHDLYRDRPVAEVDGTSLPVPSRYVTHAGVHGETIAEEVRALRPEVVVYEMFATIGVVVARALDLPAVNVLTVHAPVPSRVLAEIRANRQVATSPVCDDAVARLRMVHGIVDVHPLMYSDALSPTLNLYPEPPEHLPAGDRPALEPVDFLGCVTPRLRERGEGSPFRSAGGGRVLAAFGTIVWRYFTEEATAVLCRLAEVCHADGRELVIGLGGATLPGAVEADLTDLGATVLPEVDQWAALADADVFVTHHGLNSTHEAIYHRTPMLSYPFFGDQPRGAARCAELGLAVPLTSISRGELSVAAVRAGFAAIEARADDLASALDEAQRWELRTIEDRPRIAARVVSLAR